MQRVDISAVHQGLRYASNHVVEGNYSVILENVSCLQTLSLRRCEIDDKVCKELANKLEYGAPASKSLVSLDLTSNIISDLGAEALGKMLRRNRMLLQLCLADNRLTDKGAFYIFNSICSFALSKDDVRDLKLRYLKYCFRKIKIHEQCEKEIVNRLKQESDKENRPHKSPKKTKNRRDAGTSDFDKLTLMEQTEKMAKEFINDFTDIFDNQNINIRRGRMYSIGNFKVCYLNLAYNNLSYFSVKKLNEVLKYQRTVNKPDKCKGLLKVVLDGNNIPKVCKEMAQIESYLDTAISESISSELKEVKSIS
ncbi:leucine-rich repeat-containing protein 71-like [Pararge aegeria]|uniref:leucine-rich repeat-containing protein 71-like n=1 Tax=Pararge aegeria TaxID=116150 RepID=UPI0019D08EFA|nr:leucine-rich repeat-containing protein 71-like [Pararge aegeria]